MNRTFRDDTSKRMREIRETVIIFAIAGAAFALALTFNALQTFAEWTRKHGAWHLDAVATLLVIAACAVSVFAWRRVRALHHDLQERPSTPGTEVASEQSQKDIALRMRVERALRESEERFRLLFDASPECIAVIGLDGTILDCNAVAAELGGLPREQMIGMRFTEMQVLDKDAIPEYQEMLSQLARGEMIPPVEVKTTRDGDVRWVESYPTLLKHDNKITAIQVISRDITKRKEAEEALRESEEKYRVLFEAAPVGIGIADPEGNVLAMNQSMHAMLGFTLDEINSVGIGATYVSVDDRKRLLAALQESGSVRGWEVQLRTKDGAVYDALLNVDEVELGGRKVYLTTQRDITAQKQAQRELRKRQEELQKMQLQYQAVLRSTPHGLCMLSSNWIIQLANQAMSKIFDPKATATQDIMGLPFQALFANRQAFEQYRTSAREALRMIGSDMRELLLRRKDGTPFWSEISLVRLDPSETGSGYVATLTDITGRKRAQEEIYKLSQFQKSIIDNANVWLDVLDEGANVLIWNDAAEMISGYFREEVVGHGKIWEWLYPDDAYRKEITTKAAAIIEKGEVVEDFETTIQRKDGEKRVISWHSRNLVDERGKPIGSIALGRDVTERKRAEEALRQSEETGRALLNAPLDSVLMIDTKGTVLAINEHGARRLGKTVEELVGSCIYDFLPADVANIRRARVDEVTRTRKPVRWEDERDGLQFEQNLYPVFSAWGRVERLAIFARDITAQKRAEEQLKRLHNTYREAIKNAQGVPYLLNYFDRKYEFISEECEELLGIPHHEITQQKVFESIKEFVVTEPGAPSNPFEYSKAFVRNEFKKYRMDMRIVTPRGEEKWVSDCAVPIRDESGQFLGSVGILTDITERKRTEAALRASEERLRSQYKAIPVPTYIWQRVGEDFVLVDYNDAAATLTRGRMVELLGRKASELYPDVPEILRELERCFREKTSAKINLPYRLRTTGESRHFAGTSAYVPPDLVLIHAEDITEQKRAETINVALAALGQKLSEVSTPKDAAKVILNTADELFGWDSCYIDVYSEKDNEAHPIINIDLEDGERKEFSPVPERARLGFLSRQGRGAELILRQEVSPEKEYPLIPFGNTSRRSASLMFAPIRKGERAVGWMSIQSYTVNAYDNNDLAVFQILADYCAAALEHTFAEEELRRSNEQLRLLTEQVPAMLWTTDRDLRFTHTLGATPARDDLERENTVGKTLFEYFQTGDVSYLPIAMHRRALQGVSVSFEMEWLGRYLDIHLEPLLDAEGQIIGCIGVGNDIRRRKRAEEENEVLARLATRLAATSSLEGMIDIVREETDRLLHWDAYYLTVRRSDEDTFHLVSLVDTVAGEKKNFPVSDWHESAFSPSAQSLLEGEPLLINRPPKPASRPSGNEDVLGLTPFGDTGQLSASLMHVPVRSGEKVIGILSAQSYTPGRYDEPDLRLLLRIADTVAPALERAHAEKALRESEERFRHMVEISPFPISIIAPDGQYEYVNKRFTEVFGYRLEDISRGRQWFTLAYPDPEYRREVIAAWRSDLAKSQKGVIRPRTFRVSCKNGAVKNIVFRPMTMEDGRQFITYEDITERERAEENLKRVHQIYREAIENAHGVPYLLNYADRSYEFVSEGCENLIGIPSHELTQERLRQMVQELVVVDPAAPSDAYEYGRRFRSGEYHIYRVDYRIRTPRGEEKWISDCAVNIRDEKTGELKSSLGIFLDITERKRAEEELRLLAHFIESIAEIATITDLEDRFTFVNKAFVEKFGYTKEEIIGQRVNILRSERVPARVYDEVLEETRKGAWKGELINVTKDGHEFPVSVSTSQIRDDQGKIIGLAGIGEDITERRRAEKALAEEKERLSVTLRSIGDCVMTTDTRGNVVLINAVAEKVIGRTEEEVIGKALDEVFQIVNKKTGERGSNPVTEVLQSNEIVEIPRRTALLTPDGSERILRGSAAPIRDRAGTIIGVVLAFRDITQQQRLEEELQKRHKLESIGVLAGGIAHDFNNILTAILLNVQLARKQAEPRSQIMNSLSTAEKAALRAKDLAHQLLTFSKGGAPIKKVSSIAELIRESADFAVKGSRARCSFSIPDDLWPVDVDQGQISQVMNNLIINAKEAMPRGGTISVKAENMILETEELLPQRKGKYVKIAIRDTGVGIPEENLSRIFDPYFTTKQKGSGLGLPIAYSILKNHDGLITVDSKPGAGTTFLVYLPAVERRSPERKRTTKKQLPVSAKVKGKILLMDDDAFIRLSVSALLKDIGYTVECVRDGAEAIELYKKAQKANQPFHAVILDLVVPGGMGGRETAQKLHEIDPHVKAIVCSGYSDDPVMANFRDHGFCAVVAKPCNVEELEAVLLQAITGKGRITP